jgi:hypothetical protein
MKKMPTSAKLHTIAEEIKQYAYGDAIGFDSLPSDDSEKCKEFREMTCKRVAERFDLADRYDTLADALDYRTKKQNTLFRRLVRFVKRLF